MVVGKWMVWSKRWRIWLRRGKGEMEEGGGGDDIEEVER